MKGCIWSKTWDAAYGKAECGSRRVVAACCVFPAASLPVFKALTLPFLTPPAHFPLFQMFFVAECHKMLL